MHPPINMHVSSQTQINGITAASSSSHQQQVMVMPSNHPFPFQNGTPLVNPRAPMPHQSQFLSEFRPQFLNSTATHQNYYSPSNDLSPEMNSRFSLQRPNYTHCNRPTVRSQVPPLNANFIPQKQQQFDPRGPSFQQQAQNFRPIYIDPQKALPFYEESNRGDNKEVERMLMWNAARSGGGADEHNNKMKGNKRKNRRRKKQQEEKEYEALTAGVNSSGDAEKNIDSTKDAEKLISMETKSAKRKENLVLRKLLRGPRYFDPLESWGKVCGNGSEDHKTGACNIQKRKKPCYICGRFDHSGKHWKKKKGRFNCNLNHIPNGCLEKDPNVDENYRICFKCGDSGHSMYSCNNDYSHDDLKQIKCYICNDFGHLCCAEYADDGLRQVSCYKCGELGHSGLGCPNRHGHSIDLEAATLCDNCGEKGHIAIDCQKNAEEDDVCKSELAVKVETLSKDKEDHLGTDLCKNLLKQKDTAQGSNASVLVQV